MILPFPSQLSVSPEVDDRLSFYRLSHDGQQFVTILPMEDIERHFASAVKYHRKRLGLSQEAFAEKAGIHRTYASSVERGKVQVSIAVAGKLANALEVSLSKLFRDVERFEKGELSDESAGH